MRQQNRPTLASGRGWGGSVLGTALAAYHPGMTSQPPQAQPPPSRSAINRAGSVLRDLEGSEHPLTAEELDVGIEAFAVVQVWRDSHAYPMRKVRAGLASFLRTCEVQEVTVTSRHKRVPRIIRKLRRYETTMLARLEDIGGCRAILTDPDELERVRSHIKKKWADSIVRERDYVGDPKDMGYRAVHFVVKRDDRRIEIQLRTRGQQAWADAVEKLDGRHNLTLKDGDGPPELVSYFCLAGELIYRREYGLTVDEAFLGEFISARDVVIAAGYYSG